MSSEVGNSAVVNDPGLGTAATAENDRLEQVARMAEQLADQLLGEQILGHPVSETKIRALIAASSLLQEYGRGAPPLLSQIMQQGHDQQPSGALEPHDEAEVEGIERLAWSLRPLQGQKDQEG